MFVGYVDAGARERPRGYIALLLHELRIMPQLLLVGQSRQDRHHFVMTVEGIKEIIRT